MHPLGETPANSLDKLNDKLNDKLDEAAETLTSLRPVVTVTILPVEDPRHVVLWMFGPTERGRWGLMIIEICSGRVNRDTP